jgi:hypothetical protein
MLSQLFLLPLMLASLLFFDRRERAEVEALVQEQCVEAPNRPQVGWLANQNLPSREAILWSRGARMPGFGDERGVVVVPDQARIEVLVVPRASERLRPMFTRTIGGSLAPSAQRAHGPRRVR